MNPLSILLIGTLVVVCGILLLRLHAFLSLIAGALVVALLTPSWNTQLAAMRPAALEVQSIRPDGSVLFRPLRTKLAEGTILLIQPTYRDNTSKPSRLKIATENGTLIGRPLDGAKVDPTDLILDPTAADLARKSTSQTAGERIAEGFGKTATSIGILIAMAAIIGQTLLESGAAERIILATRRALGDRRTPLAFVFSGFLLTIPCFFETVFYLMIPLGKIMRARTGRDYTLYVMCIVAGGTMAHSLVPPTPGPIFAARELGIPIGHMMLGGFIVGILAASAGYLYARWANLRWDIPLCESVGVSPTEMKAAATRDESTLPPLGLSLIPILLPILLIGSGTILDSMKAAGKLQPSPLIAILQTLGDKNIALILAAAAGLLLVATRGGTRSKIRDSVQHALGGSATMILIICAGGAFGHVLRQTDIAASLREIIPVGKLSLLLLAFLMTTFIRTAQGSATVAIITAAGICGPIAAAGGLGFNPVYLALAIGCGSKPFMWMNDSGFWIISRMSGFTEAETLKTASTMMAIMAVVGLGVTVLGAWLLPML